LISGLLALSCVDLLGDVDVQGGGASAPPALEPEGSIALPSPETNVSGAPDDEATIPLPPASPDEASPGDLGSTEQPVSDVLQPGPAVPAVCELGSFRCQGAELELCLNGAAWVEWQTCGSAMLCQSEPAGRCLPQACAPDSFRCVDGSLERCDEDLTGWSEVAVCATPAHCDPLQRECLDAPCAPGQQRCNGAELEQCSSDRLGWDLLETCASASLCQSGSAAEPARCAEPLCTPEEYRCAEGGVLQVCNLERTGFSNLAQCATAALCNAALGSCAAPACQPGQHACSPSGEILICNGAQSGFTSQAPRVVCGAEQTCDALRAVCIDPPAPPPPADEEDEGDNDDERGNNGRDRDDDDDDRGRGNGRRD
jgi:hypothetical protein